MFQISPVLWQFLEKWLTAFALFPPEAAALAPYMDALYFFLMLSSLVGVGIVAMLVFVCGALLYFRVYNPPPNAMNIHIVGKQWMWQAEHPGGQHEINALHTPVGQPVQLTMISQDVFHSFSIPDFRIKREV